MVIDQVVIGCIRAMAGWWLGRVRSDRSGFPPEFRRARIAYAEKLFRSTGPLVITARVDRVYRAETGTLVLAEFKTRVTDRVYPSDVIELSAQRLALMAQTGETVAEYAYVLTRRLESRPTKWHRVRLLPVTDVLTLGARWNGLITGKVAPRPPCLSGICPTCPFVHRCNWRS